jgi:hypothetical protein
LFLDRGVARRLDQKVLDATVETRGRFSFNLEDAHG